MLLKSTAAPLDSVHPMRMVRPIRIDPGGNPMNKDDLILVSVDDHVVEPPDVFEKHLPAKYQEFAPKLKERDDGTLAWYYYEHEITNVGLNAVRGPAEGGVRHRADPVLPEMRKGCWDVDERIKDMNAGGLLGSLCFPSMPGFVGPQSPRPPRTTRSRP